MPADAPTDCILRFEVTSPLEPWGTLGSLTHRGPVARSGWEQRAGTGCRAVSTGTWGFLDFPACRWRVRGWGAPSAPRLRAHSLEASVAVCRACPRRSSLGGSTAGNSLFSSNPNQTKRLLETCLGRDQMPNGLAPSYSFLLLPEPPCGLGRISQGPTPTRGNWLGGRGSLSWCLGWSVGEPSELGAGASAVG